MSDDKSQTTGDEEQINIVTEQPVASVEKEERRAALSKGGDDDSSEDQGRTDEEREAIRARRREERQQRKQHNREVRESQERLISSLQLQNRDLSDRLAQIESRQAGGEAASLDQQLNEALRTAEEAKQHIKNATEAGDGEAVADATELLYAARRRAEHLHAVKQRQAQTKQQRPAQSIAPEASRLAMEWVNRNSWYKANGGDRDSQIARQVDSQLASEGYDPRTSDYWEELEYRLADELPHRFESNNNGTHKPDKVPVNGGTRREAPRTKDVYISPERVQAMKDAGIWEDEKRRNEMVKRYMEFDRNQK